MYEWLYNEDFFPTLQGNALLGDLSSENFFGEACPRTPLEVWAFGPQFYRVPAYSQASALLLQKLMKTLRDGLQLTRLAILFREDCKPDTRAAEIEPICCP